MSEAARDSPPHGPDFAPGFRAEFAALLAWRRDVRRFRPGDVPEPLLAELLESYRVRALGRQLPADAIGARRRTFKAPRDRGEFRSREPRGAVGLRGRARRALCKTQACGPAGGARASCRLLRRGDRTRPRPRRGHHAGNAALFLGLRAAYVLARGARARARRRLGVDSRARKPIAEILDVPRAWALVAYLCVGWPEDEKLTPELERAGWQARVAPTVLRR